MCAIIIKLFALTNNIRLNDKKSAATLNVNSRFCFGIVGAGRRVFLCRLFHGDLLDIFALTDNVDAVGKILDIIAYHHSLKIVDLHGRGEIDVTGC